jgi:lysophospholipase L1-like esterase
MGCSCAAPAGASIPAAATPPANVDAAAGGGAATQSTTQSDAADGAKDTKPKADKPAGGGGGDGASKARKGVLLIGDSLTVGTKPYFTEQLAGQPVQVDATSGISLAEGMRRYHAAKDKPRVVEMALFTNNSPGQKEELRKAIEETIKDAKERGGKVVWATIVRPGNYGEVNDMIRDYAARNPGVMEVVDWAKMVQQHPGYVGGDGVHSGAEGYKARAKAFADAAK